MMSMFLLDHDSSKWLSMFLCRLHRTTQHKRLRGGFKYFLFSPLPGEMFQFEYIFLCIGWKHQLEDFERMKQTIKTLARSSPFGAEVAGAIATPWFVLQVLWPNSVAFVCFINSTDLFVPNMNVFVRKKTVRFNGATYIRYPHHVLG